MCIHEVHDGLYEIGCMRKNISFSKISIVVFGKMLHHILLTYEKKKSSPEHDKPLNFLYGDRVPPGRRGFL